MMHRQPNTDLNGLPFAEDLIEQVWQKARLEYGTRTVGYDVCGKQINRLSYGVQSDLGWEIDHIRPVAKGGTDDLENLQPLFWQSNRIKSDTYPWECSMLNSAAHAPISLPTSVSPSNPAHST